MEQNEVEIKNRIIEHYKKVYPNWKDISVTELVKNTFSGHLAVVRATIESGHEDDEICFYYPEGTVRHFITTEELARFLELKAKTPILERIFTRPVITGLVFVFALLAVYAAGFFQDSYNKESLAILGSVLGLAAGFFFGTQK